MSQRAQRVEANFQHSVKEQAERLLLVLEPDQLINWGALKYINLLVYLRDRLDDEIAGVTPMEEE